MGTSRWLGRTGSAALVAAAGCLVMACGQDSFEGVFPVPDDLYAASAVGPDHLWVAGYFGAIYRTRDGGKSWQKLPTPTRKSIYDVSFADEKHGWAVGRRGFVIHTDDGGDTWERQEIPRKPARHIFGIEAVSRDVAWAVGDWGGRYATHDGGKTWEDHSFLVTRDHPAFRYLSETEMEAFERGEPVYDDIYLNDVHFLDPMRGWIVGEYGIIYRTVDGGNTWTKSRIIGAVRFDPIPFSHGLSEIVRELWPPLFEAAEILNEKEYLRLRVDACVTPKELEETGSTLLADERAESLRDFLEGEGIGEDRIRLLNPTPFDEEGVDMEAFRRSKICDHGHVTVRVVETPFLFNVKFTPAGEGLIAGLGGVVLHSTDGGETWRYVDADSRQAFFAVGFGARSLVAVGEKGLERVSRDRGKTWTSPTEGFPPVISFMRDLVFASPERGWIVGANSLVLRTSDGGLTWEKVRIQSVAASVDHAAGE